uniref:Uncharacterized protein n=1 Tax=Anguilla anguilla TaxID=7936 RepID=A0A0E9VJJ2_ANGAN
MMSFLSKSLFHECKSLCNPSQAVFLSAGSVDISVFASPTLLFQSA